MRRDTRFYFYCLMLLILMMLAMPICINPVTIKRDGKLIHVPCGKCFECNMTKRNQWTFRLKSELENSDSALFATLTYNEDNVKDLNVRDCQLFLKRVREENRKHVVDLKFKYYLTAEYGGQFKRPHYHVIMFNLVVPVVNKLEKLWGMGFVDIIPVELGSINYINTFHVIGKYDGNPSVLPFNLMSKGIGKKFIDDNGWNLKEREEGYITNEGYNMKLPRYYYDKIFSVRQKERMAEYMRDLSLKKQLEFEKEAMEKGINPFKLKVHVREQKRSNFIKKSKERKSL